MRKMVLARVKRRSHGYTPAWAGPLNVQGTGPRAASPATKLVALSVVLLILAGPGPAKERLKLVIGNVAGISSGTVAVLVLGSRRVAVLEVSKDTEFVKLDPLAHRWVRVEPDDLRLGDRVGIRARKIDGKLQAAMISIGSVRDELLEEAEARGAATGRAAADTSDRTSRSRFPQSQASAKTPERPTVVEATAFSSDGRFLAAALPDKVAIWQTESGALGRQLPMPIPRCDEVTRLAFSRDGGVLAAAVGGCHVSYARGVVRWRVGTGQIVENFGSEYTASLGFASVGDLAYSPEGRYLALGTLNGLGGPSVLVVDTNSGKVIQSLAGDAAWVGPLAFSVDGKLAGQPVAFVAMIFPRLMPVTVWEATTGRVLRSYRGCSWLGESALAFSPDGRTLAAGDWKGNICSWDVQTGEEYPALRLGDAVVRALAFSDGGKALASVASDDTLRLWDTSRGREVRRCTVEVAGPRRHDWTVAFSPGARMLATGGRDGSAVHLWDVSTCAELWKSSN